MPPLTPSTPTPPTDTAAPTPPADAGLPKPILMCQPPPYPPRARLRELEAGQRVALHAHAMHMWGARWQQSPDEPVVTLRAS
jgi:hypothetical protein